MGVRPAAPKRWLYPVPAPEAESLASTLKLPAPLAQVLIQRGFGDPAAAAAFLNPQLRLLHDPFELPDMTVAVERIWEAIRAGESIALYGDYDVDGITSLAILLQVLSALGARVKPFLPLRLEEGYGLSVEALERCVSECHPRLVLAVDCGTTSLAEARWLSERGVDLIIADHHEPAEERPVCVALVNPKTRAAGSHYLCSAGLAFKVAHALLKHVGTRDVDLKDYLDLVAVGTVADIVPLVEDNRILVRSGLERLAETRNIGLRALMDVAKVEHAPGTTDVGFRIGPRLNAAGRLGDAMKALDLLTTRDAAVARTHSLELDTRNRERQEIERQTFDEALAMVEATFDPETCHALVVGKRGWHPGVIGIVASRLQKQFWRPAFVIAIDEHGVGKGSGRSVEGCHLIEGLKECGSHLLRYGGHEMAAGLNIAEAELGAFSAAFNAWGARHLVGDLRIMPVRLDAEVPFSQLNAAFIDHLESLRPFGSANPEPIFFTRRVTLARPSQMVGRNHLRLRLDHGGVQHDAIAFNMADRTVPSVMDVAFVPTRDEYWGDDRIQLRIQDFVPAA